MKLNPAAAVVGRKGHVFLHGTTRILHCAREHEPTRSKRGPLVQNAGACSPYDDGGHAPVFDSGARNHP